MFTRGTSQLRAEHGSHPGVGLDIPDLADGERHDGIEYDLVRAGGAPHPSFQAGPIWISYPHAVGYRHGLGVLKVFVDDMSGPALSVPMNSARS